MEVADDEEHAKNAAWTGIMDEVNELLKNSNDSEDKFKALKKDCSEKLNSIVTPEDDKERLATVFGTKKGKIDPYKSKKNFDDDGYNPYTFNPDGSSGHPE